MATITPGVFTYTEWALRHDPSGRLSTLVNLLSQENGIMDDMMAVECQSGNAFEFTQVVKLPTPTNRSYNQGITATLAGVAKQVQTAVEYADLITIDRSLAQLGGTMAELRAQETQLHAQGMGQKVAADLFYSNNATNPTTFTGFANIYNTVTTSTSQIANNVIDCAGTGSTNASLWLIGWGPKQIHTIFPNGFPAGLQMIDRGLQNTYDADAKLFLGWQHWLQWNIGLAIHDWRYAVRACNIDVTTFGSATAPDLIAILAAMVYKPPVMPAGVAPVQTSDVPQITMPTRFAFYCNRTIFLALDLQAQNKANMLLRIDEWAGRPTLTYRGIPIRCVDALLNTESRVV